MSIDISGKKVVFTGQLDSGTRDEVKARATALGADVDTAVSSRTDYLVCGEDVAHNSKHTKVLAAKEHGVTIVSESQWNAIIEDVSS
ncbi:MAG: BRCT domain-containing protein [Myxococcota bacterium]|nr:BRCT domain-containing protein [Myxococcota bacterium]